MDTSYTFVRNKKTCIEEVYLGLELMAKDRFESFGSPRLIDLKLVPTFLQKVLPKLVDPENRTKFSQILEEITLYLGLKFEFEEEYEDSYALTKISDFMRSREEHGPRKKYSVKVDSKLTQQTLNTVFQRFWSVKNINKLVDKWIFYLQSCYNVLK